jgi:urease accessory protein
MLTRLLHLYPPSERSQHLHLFLHARALLSAAIRMNTIGPYAAQQLLLHAIRPLVDSQLAQCRHIRTGVLVSEHTAAAGATTQEDPTLTVDGPANTWPLGEILAARHDLQHSRMFNS